MAARFVNIDYDTPLILPPNLRDWVPAGHLAHFILDAVAEMDLRRLKVNERGTGSEQYPPRMLLALLLYCYATGVFSSRRMEQASYDSVPVRMMCGDTHPDHDTLCTFRRENKALLQEAFVRVLELAQALKFLQVGQITVAVDGTKMLAHASKHSAVSYEHAGKAIEQLDLEVKALMAKAEQADSTPLEDGLSIPAEIQRRQDRKAKLAARPPAGGRRDGRPPSPGGRAGGAKRKRPKATRPGTQAPQPRAQALGPI
jgi:transposase